MILFKKANDLSNYLDKQRKQGKIIGFVPTMGALHDGHVSLINASKKSNAVTVCSIFVNPTQFNDPKDFEKYPITLEKDIVALESTGCNILFLPSVAEMYPGGTTTSTHYDLGYLETIMEGRYRPGHFQGVCRVVDRLLTIVQPDNLYLGQKDYQQCMIVKRLIELIGMNESIILTICPTLREANGLAMSSRNMRLSISEKLQASAIYQTLFSLKSQLKPDSLVYVTRQAAQSLEQAGFKVDYIVIADAGNLQPVSNWDGNQKLVALSAAYLNEVRLIDNILLN
jgi:pantoate--beta-alanine ligase